MSNDVHPLCQIRFSHSHAANQPQIGQNGLDSGPKDHINIRISHSSSKAQLRGIPETMVCRILMSMWSGGPIRCAHTISEPGTQMAWLANAGCRIGRLELWRGHGRGSQGRLEPTAWTYSVETCGPAA